MSNNLVSIFNIISIDFYFLNDLILCITYIHNMVDGVKSILVFFEVGISEHVTNPMRCRFYFSVVQV